MKKIHQVIPPKHVSCDYFNLLVSTLEKDHKDFSLTKLASELDCSTERIRRIRLGIYELGAGDITVLMDKYQANPLYLLRGKLPMRISDSNLSLVNEAQAVYGPAQVMEDNKLLQEQLIQKNKTIEDKEKIIGLYEKQLGISSDAKKRA
jgi:hypothetical protein